MPDYGKRTGRDAFESLERRLASAERELRRGRGGGLSTFDRGDTLTQPAPVEGQTIIQYDTDEPWYYANGEWRDFCCPVTSGGAGYAAKVVEIGATDLVAYWKMDAASGNEPDYSPSPPYGDKPLIPVAGTGVYDVTGALPAGDDDGAYKYNNSGGFSATDTSARWGFPGLAPFTAAFFFKPYSTGTTGGPLQVVGTTESSGPPSNGWHIGLYRANSVGAPRPGPIVYFDYEGGGSGDSTLQGTPPVDGGSSYGGGACPFNVWTHIVCTFDGTNMRQYHNGTLESTKSAGGSLTGGSVIHVLSGAVSGAAVCALVADIDEIMIVKRALTAAEIVSLYTAASGGYEDAGEALTADGTGGTTWRYPVGVWINGA